MMERAGDGAGSARDNLINTTLIGGGLLASHSPRDAKKKTEKKSLTGSTSLFTWSVIIIIVTNN